MKKDISISITTQSFPKGDEPQTISTEAKGTVYQKDGLLYISYKENPEEFGKTLTTVKIKNDRVELIRTGNVSSRLVFIKDKPYESSYNTPYGSLPLKISVLDMDISAGGDAGTVFMKYSLDLAGDQTENNFTLKYKCI